MECCHTHIRPVMARCGSQSCGLHREQCALPRSPASRSDDEEMQVAADRCQRLVADGAELPPGSLVGHGADLLGHGVGDLLQPGLVIRGNLDVMSEAAVPAGKRHREEQSGNHRVPVMRHDHDRTDAALLPPGYRIKVAQQYVAAGQELYSGYSPTAMEARSPRPAEVHSAASA